MQKRRKQSFVAFFSSYYVNKNWISWLMRHFANFQISIIFFIYIKEKQTKVNWKKMMMLLYAKGFLQWWNYMSIKEKGLLVFKKDQLFKWSDRVSLVVLSSRTIWYLAAFLFVVFWRLINENVASILYKMQITQTDCWNYSMPHDIIDSRSTHLSNLFNPIISIVLKIKNTTYVCHKGWFHNYLCIYCYLRAATKYIKEF